MTTRTMPAHTKLDERHHVDLPFMEQLDGSGWNMVGQTVDVLECAEKPHQNGKPGALS